LNATVRAVPARTARVRAPARPGRPAHPRDGSRQSLHAGEPLALDVRCAAACELRGTLAAHATDPRLDDGVAVGTAGRASAGRVRLLIQPSWTDHAAPRHGGPVRAVVRASAPGGTSASRTVARTRVRRRPVPPLRQPSAVRARRAGDDVIVTWRTAGPARRMTFVASTSRSRRAMPGLAAPTAQRRGRGRRSFELILRDAGHARWVQLVARVA